MLKHLIYLIYGVMTLCPVTASGVTEQSAVQQSATDIAGSLQNPKRPCKQASGAPTGKKGKNIKRKTKKQTCRKDRPRGRRPKKHTDDVNVSCSGCGEQYLRSTDEWLQCSMPRCKLWYELSCTGLRGVSRAVQNKFVCEQCK